jgi:hypothetical protein
LWSAHITARPGQVVTVVARGVDPATLQLSGVPELRPYVNAWEEHQLKAVAAAAFMTAQNVAEEIPAQGLDAHISLMRAWLVVGPGTGSLRAVGALVSPRSGTPEHRRLWEAAARTQMHYAAQTDRDADYALGAMVNQALRLAERATWFSDRKLVVRAIEEMARYTVFDSDVPSRRAQEWWGRVWSLSVTPLPEDPDVARERRREHSATESVWLTAWERWATGDAGHGHRR